MVIFFRGEHVIGRMVDNVFPNDENDEQEGADGEAYDDLDLIPTFHTPPVESEEDENTEDDEEKGSD